MNRRYQMNDHLMTTAEAAKFLGYHPQTLMNYRSLGIGPRWVRQGRRIKYRKVDLRQFKFKRGVLKSG